jgi:general secretion pathway protein M
MEAPNPLAFVERFSRMNPRERRLLTLLGGLVAFIVFIGLPIGLEIAVHSRRSDVEDLRKALDDVQRARSSVRERQSQKDSIVARYARKAPALAGFLEQLARAQKLEVTDSVDRPDVPHGKKYTERDTIIHLKKAGLASISRFLESIEKSGYPVMLARLDLRKRSGEPDSYDVEVGVSAYDRVEKAETAPTPASSGGTP